MREGGRWGENNGGREAVEGMVGGSVEGERDGRMDGGRMKGGWVGVRGGRRDAKTDGVRLVVTEGVVMERVR